MLVLSIQYYIVFFLAVSTIANEAFRLVLLDLEISTAVFITINFYYTPQSYIFVKFVAGHGSYSD